MRLATTRAGNTASATRASTQSTIISRTKAAAPITNALMENGAGLMNSMAFTASLSAWAMSSPAGRRVWNRSGAVR